jgi:hypothetical protein
MVIKPKTTFNKPGVEFVLTYFDKWVVFRPIWAQKVKVAIEKIAKLTCDNNT